MSTQLTQDTSIRAYHRPTNTWQWAVVGYDGTYARLDPDHSKNEKLEDFDVWVVDVVSTDDAGQDFFRPLYKVEIEKVLS